MLADVGTVQHALLTMHGGGCTQPINGALVFALRRQVISLRQAKRQQRVAASSGSEGPGVDSLTTWAEAVGHRGGISAASQAAMKGGGNSRHTIGAFLADYTTCQTEERNQLMNMLCLC